MPRRLRIELPGGLYHVTNRGVDRKNIVRNDDDRHEWFRLLKRVATRCGWRVFAHVLMTNHFHLLLKLHEPNLSSGLHVLKNGYATLFKTNHERTGPVFQGSFHAVLVKSEDHAWSLTRYIHLNPYRAMRHQTARGEETGRLSLVHLPLLHGPEKRSKLARLAHGAA